MILQDGPLDGEQQICAALPTDSGSVMYFSLPSFQTFAEDGETVTSLGLTANYILVGEGPPPVPANGDTWDTSWVYTFAGEEFVPRPPPIPTPTPPPISLAFVSMYGAGNMVVTAQDPIPGPPQLVLTGETTLEADLGFVPTASISMEAVTVFVGSASSQTRIYLAASSGMTVTAS